MLLRRFGWILCLALLVAMPQVSHALYFEQGESYKAVPLGSSDVEFRAPIRGSNGTLPDQIQITFSTYFPDGDWFGQFCQTSTGICYIDNHVVTVSSVEVDTIRVDFLRFLSPGPGVGWVRIEAKRVADPTDIARCTYTLFNGVAVPTAKLNIDCSNNTQFLATGNDTFFMTPIKNATATPDSAICFLNTTMPSPWFGQYCQDSNGICYLGDASMYLPANVQDNVRVDFFMFNTPGKGRLDLELHSWKNPSFWQWCHYRVFVGNQAAGVVPMESKAPVPSWAQPNPFHGSTELYFGIENASEARLEIFGADGRRVRSFDGLRFEPGLAHVSWDGTDGNGNGVAAGAYYYRLYSPQGVGKGLIVRTH